MTDSNLVDVLGRQTDAPVGLLALASVRSGPEAVAQRLKRARSLGCAAHRRRRHQRRRPRLRRHRRDRGCGSLTGGAGLAGALGTSSRAPPRTAADQVAAARDLPPGPGIILAGSCSRATLAQVAAATAVFPSHRLDPVATPDPDTLLDAALAWLREHWGTGPLVVYSSATPDRAGRSPRSDGTRHVGHPRDHTRRRLPAKPPPSARPASWSPAERRRAPSSRPSASAASWSWARRTPACPGACPPTPPGSPCF